MPTLDDNREDGNIGWIHARNPCCLCERLRAELLELLTAFKSHGRADIIVKPGRNLDGLILLGARCGDFFLTNITRVMMPDPELFDNRQKIVRLKPFARITKFYKSIRMLRDKVPYLIKRFAGVQMLGKFFPVNLVDVQRPVLDVADG